jgi:hypothetical protein
LTEFHAVTRKSDGNRKEWTHKPREKSGLTIRSIEG